MKPVVSTIRPNLIHTGGRTVVEITGSGFRVPPAEDEEVVPVPAPRPTVRVLFGSVEAEEVAVADDGLIYANAPEHDPGSVSITVENLDGSPARLTSAVGPFVLSNGLNLVVTVDGRTPQTVTFLTADFVSIGAATAKEVAAVIGTTLRSCLEKVSAGAVVIETDSRGDEASLQMSGSALAALGFSGAVAVGDDDVREVIPSESTVVAAAVTFARPNLGIKSGLARVMEEFILKLRRQIHDNVSIATHTEYDATTGDGYNIAFMATFPGLLLIDWEFPFNTEESHSNELELPEDGDDPERIVVKAAPTVVDAMLTILGVAETMPEMLNLTAVTLRFFKKNAKLRVPRDADNLSRGYVNFDMYCSKPDSVKATREAGNAPVQAFAIRCCIKQIQVEDMPLLNEGPVPGGARSGVAQESTTEIARTNESLELTMAASQVESSDDSA